MPCLLLRRPALDSSVRCGHGEGVGDGNGVGGVASRRRCRAGGGCSLQGGGVRGVDHHREPQLHCLGRVQDLPYGRHHRYLFFFFFPCSQSSVVFLLPLFLSFPFTFYFLGKLFSSFFLWFMFSHDCPVALQSSRSLIFFFFCVDLLISALDLLFFSFLSLCNQNCMNLQLCSPFLYLLFFSLKMSFFPRPP